MAYIAAMARKNNTKREELLSDVCLHNGFKLEAGLLLTPSGHDEQERIVMKGQSLGLEENDLYTISVGLICPFSTTPATLALVPYGAKDSLRVPHYSICNCRNAWNCLLS
jgi:hypothetical protein